jgi:hypothetical protein
VTVKCDALWDCAPERFESLGFTVSPIVVTGSWLEPVRDAEEPGRGTLEKAHHDGFPT